MERNKCPYCWEGLHEQTAEYLLTWQDDSVNIEQEYVRLGRLLRACKESSDGKIEARYQRVWKNYNHQRNELLFQTNDYILSKGQVQELIKGLNRSEVRTFQRPLRSTVRENLNFGKEDESELEEDEELLVEHVEPEAELQEKYFFKRRNTQNDADWQGDISRGANDAPIAYIRRVCPHCYNLIADDLYKYPIVNVYLMAVPGSGKTCMLYSLFVNQDKFNAVNEEHMKWESIQDMSVDKYFEKFYREMRKYEKSKKVDPTSQIFIPPLFLKVTYKEKTMIVALFDNAGELFRENKNSRLFNQKIKNMDALLCIINTEQSELARNSYRMKLEDDDIRLICEKSRVLSADEQEEAESNVLAEELTIEEILNRVLNKKMNHSDDEYKETMKESGQRLFTNLGNYLGGQTEMNNIVKDKYLSLVISRTDRLVHSAMILENEKKLFFENRMDYFSEIEKQRKLQRDKKMRQWKREGFLLDYDLEKFRDVNYHFVAAHIDGHDGIHPIRVEEPLVGIVEDFIRKGVQKE